MSTCGQAPTGVTGRVQYGPEVTARAANLICGHYLPVSRAARLMRTMLGVAVSVGTMASIRGRAARLLEDTFLPAVAVGLSNNLGKRSRLAADALTLARRFRDHEDMILRFMTDLTVPFQSERDVSVKIQQRTSGGCWRTLTGLANFAVVQSYLSTATKWGIDTLDALRQLFTTGPWLPPILSPDHAAPAA